LTRNKFFILLPKGNREERIGLSWTQSEEEFRRVQKKLKLVPLLRERDKELWNRLHSNYNDIASSGGG